MSSASSTFCTQGRKEVQVSVVSVEVEAALHQLLIHLLSFAFL